MGRYLDVTRAELVFARGIILVEGDAERFLIPAFAAASDISLDEHGISICSVSGTNFKPYAKLLSALGISFAVIKDYAPVTGKPPLSYKRALNLVRTIDEATTAGNSHGLRPGIDIMKHTQELFDLHNNYKISVNK